MSKILPKLKYILLIVLLVLIGLFVYRYYIKYSRNQTAIEITLKMIVMYILLGIYYIINIKNLFRKKSKINNPFKYHLVNIIGILPIIVVFTRMMIDPTIISNIKSSFVEKGFLIGQGYSFIEYNSLVIIIILILLIVYHFLNIRKSTKK